MSASYLKNPGKRFIIRLNMQNHLFYPPGGILCYRVMWVNCARDGEQGQSFALKMKHWRHTEILSKVIIHMFKI